MEGSTAGMFLPAGVRPLVFLQGTTMRYVDVCTNRYGYPRGRFLLLIFLSCHEQGHDMMRDGGLEGDFSMKLSDSFACQLSLFTV